MAKTPEAGDPAPDFTCPDDTGEPLSLSSLKGKPVVLYFYPKDDTAGCTKEAIGFTESLDNFDAQGATVLWVSKDSVATHEKFKRKHGLKIRLISDEDGKLCDAYGTWVEKSMYGRKYMGIERATYLIDATGTINRAWRKVKVPGHVDEVLAAAEAL